MASSSGINECCLFFGMTGAGKSSTINKICGQVKCAVGESETSETQNCKLVRVESPQSIFHGKALLDMQGWGDTRIGHNQNTIFEMIKLYFMQNDIKTVKCVIFVVNIGDSRTNHYSKFSKFLGDLFSENHIKMNALILVTKCDALVEHEKQVKLRMIKESVVQLKHDHNWCMEVIEWSNTNPLPNQEKTLLAAVSRLPGFDPSAALKAEAKKIDDDATKLYEAKENIIVVKHAAVMELKEFKTNRVVEENIPVNCDEVVEKVVPAQKESRKLEVQKNLHFKGGFGFEKEGFWNSVGNGVTRLSTATGLRSLMTAVDGRETQTERKALQFDHPVLSVKFDKTPDDIHLLDKLKYEVDESKKVVTVVADYSWGGSVVQRWDFDLTVTATIEQTIVVKEQYTDKVTVAKQRIEKVKKTVTDIEKRLEQVKPAYEEKFYKRTREEIRRSIIDERLLKMT